MRHPKTGAAGGTRWVTGPHAVRAGSGIHLAAIVVVLSAMTGCNGGHLSAIVNMPGPSGKSDSFPGAETQGVRVDAGDGTSVCSRLQVSLSPVSSAPPDVAAAPSGAATYSSRGTGNYDADKRQCAVVLYGLEPRGDYWLFVNYPTTSPADAKISYYVAKGLGSSSPSLNSTSVRLAGGGYPVVIVDKQTTSITITLSERRADLPTPQPPGP